MAVSNAALFITIAQVGAVALMLTNKTRIWRMLGAITVILIGISAGTIEDTQAAAIFM